MFVSDLKVGDTFHFTEKECERGVPRGAYTVVSIETKVLHYCRKGSDVGMQEVRLSSLVEVEYE